MDESVDIEDVWSKYRARIKAFLHSRIADSDEVDDLLQEILLKSFEGFRTLKSHRSAKSWLFQIANNAVVDFYRKRGRSRDLNADDLWYGENETDVHRELSNCVEPFINALPGESAALLTAVDIRGESQKEVADRLGISYSTLKSRVQKSRKQLLKVYSDCCDLSLDHQGRLLEFKPKSKSCNSC